MSIDNNRENMILFLQGSKKFTNAQNTINEKIEAEGKRNYLPKEDKSYASP